MADLRYRSIFFAILSLTVIWFLVTLVYLPQPPDVEHRPAFSEYRRVPNDDQADHYSHSTNTYSLQGAPSTNHAKLHQKYIQSRLPSTRLAFADHLNIPIHHLKFSPATTLFYQFNLKSQYSVTNQSVISKELHDTETLKLGKLSNSADHYIKNEGFALFAFNLLVSNRIGLIRSLPDTRNDRCPMKKDIKSLYHHQTPDILNSATIKLQASIIICYYNEAPSALLRTIYTILKRSPRHFLREIIVVDDFSNDAYNYNKVKAFIDTEKPVKFLRTTKREGLIRARLFGSHQARGDVLVFLDSHVETNVGWLEPLLEVIQEKNNTIACPMIDLINPETLIYSSSPMVKGGLNWALNFKWDSVPSNQLKTYDDFIKPILSPTMAGGLYAVNRDYFTKLGEYDSGMDLWGGENVELSIRVWLCGGQIVILPCSRVGHIFRKRRPYGLDTDQSDSLIVNSLRTAKVWLDEYIDKFYEAIPEAQFQEVGESLQPRIELRQRLGCRNFLWYIDNVYPALKKELQSSSDRAESSNSPLPKLFKFRYKQIDHRDNESYNSYEKIIKTASKNRMQRQVSHPSMFQDSRVSEKTNFHKRNSFNPKSISQFQIKLMNSSLCIESEGDPLAQGSARLVLARCAELQWDQSGNMIAVNSRILDQLWTETDFHDYRLGEDDKCLDLMRNQPQLRKCHRMGSFQKWVHNNHNVFNRRGKLCLGVERVQLGEPIIVTICDKHTDDLISDRSPGQYRQIRRDSALRSWTVASLIWNLNGISDMIGTLRPHQKWVLIYTDNSSASTLKHQDQTTNFPTSSTHIPPAYVNVSS